MAVSAISTATGTRYRVVSEAVPAGALAIEPTLEDGYVAVMRAHRVA